ncbi:MAG: hypothetical protein Q9162_001715 [Coniocarpon cinnabarinum]
MPLDKKEIRIETSVRKTSTDLEDPAPPNDNSFKTMRWWNVSLLMIAEVISLGILALPHATAKLGFFPAVFFIVTFGFVATYAGYVIGTFKLRFMEVGNVGDAGAVLFSPYGPRAANLGRRVFGTLSVAFLVFIMAAHVLSFGIMMNVVTNHGTCTIVFLVCGTLLSIFLCLPRRLVEVSWISIVSMFSIFGAVVVTVAGVSHLHPGGNDLTKAIAKDTRMIDGIVALMDIIMAYSGNVAFFNFMSEMRDPREYRKALFTLQTLATIIYVLAATVIYYFAGPDIAAPALGSAGPLMRKIAYYLAMPTIVIAGVVNGHVAIKMVFRSWKRGMEEQKGWTPYCWWVGLNVGLWTIAWVLAESIPNFGNLLALVSSSLGTWFTYGLSAGLWFFMHKGKYWNSKFGLVANTLILIGTVALSGFGMWASLVAIREDSSGTAWACASNEGY